MAITEISNTSRVLNQKQSFEAHKTESNDNSETHSHKNIEAVSVRVSISTVDIVKSHSVGIQRAQNRFERIDQDNDGKASQDELIAIKKELNDKGRQTPGLDRVIQNFSKLDKDGDSGLQFNELHPQANHQKPPSESSPVDQAASAPDVVSADSSSIPAAKSDSDSDPELKELLNALESSGIKNSQSYFNSKNGSSISSSTDNSYEKEASAPKSSAIDPNTAFASYYQTILPGGAEPDALDRVVQSSSVIRSDPKGAVSQTLQYYGLKINN